MRSEDAATGREPDADGSERVSSVAVRAGSADEDHMPTSAQCSRLVVYGLPLAFVVFSWFASTSFPDFLKVDDSFVSSLQTTENIYSHNPNAPRYLHYVLLRLGVRDLSLHVLV